MNYKIPKFSSFNRNIRCIEIRLKALRLPSLNCSTETLDVLKYGLYEQRQKERKSSTETLDVLK